MLSSDVLDSVTKFVNSPPGQIAAGGVLAGIVWKFFERVEAVLTDMTKFEVAVWLVGVEVGKKIEPWPETFSTIFDRVFGNKHLSWRCFRRSCLATLCAIVFTTIGLLFANVNRVVNMFEFMRHHLPVTVLTLIVGNLVPDYVALLATRRVWSKISPSASTIDNLINVYSVILASMASATVGQEMAYRTARLYFYVFPAPSNFFLEKVSTAYDDYYWYMPILGLWGVPAFFTAIWILLYAGSGFLLKAARRFDIGFHWFNRKFDIEHRPLQAIGLVAGALVAVVYWAAVFVSRII